MIDWSESALMDLMEVYSFANTSDFLYRRFERNPFVTSLASTYAAQEIATEIGLILAKDVLDLEDVVKVYAALCAFKGKNPEDVHDALDGVPLTRLRWGTIVLSYAIDLHASTTPLLLSYQNHVQTSSSIILTGTANNFVQFPSVTSS